MVEIKMTRPGRVGIVQDGREVGEVRWSVKTLAWGRERVRVAAVETLTCPAEYTPDLWDYLRYLWQKEAVAAVEREGALTWFSRALEQSWQAAGSPPLS